MIRASRRPRWAVRRGSTRHGLPEPDADDAANLQKLLDELSGHHDRRVSYVAELVAIDPEGREFHGRGELRGTLAEAPRGGGGFGYDPAFIPEGELRTVGEMSAAEKDAISHRARAADALQRAIHAG